MKWRKRFSRGLPIFFLLCFLVACAGSEVAKPTYYYTLDYPAPAPMATPQLPYVLRVDRFAATPPFHTQRIIYADKGLHRNAYAHFQWIAAPGEMMAFFLGRDLRSSNGFKAVLPPDADIVPTHTVKGWVETFIEEDFTDNGHASLKLSVTLMDAREPDVSRRVLFQKSYAARQACRAKTPAALAEAMSAAAARVSANVLTDIYDALTAVSNP